jgi:hypothetical protein
MKIELLYFEECPAWKNSLKNLEVALIDEQIREDIRLIMIINEEMAAKEKFLGSPSFRIDGQDLWPEERTSYHLGCRLYANENGLRGSPTVEMLRAKLRAAVV